MKRLMEKTRQQLGELGALADKTERTERQILARAEDRLKEVQALVDRARPGVETAPPTEQDRYQALVAERGQLQMIVAQAKAALQ